MKKENPQNSSYDIFVNAACLFLLAGTAVYLFAVWDGLPEKIPGHYNAAGEIDRWGNKSELFVLPVVSLFLYLLITVTERFPRIWNTGVKVTDENKERVFRILKNLIGTVKLAVVTIFTFIAFCVSLARALTGWFLPVSLCFCCGPLVFFSVKLIKAK